MSELLIKVSLMGQKSEYCGKIENLVNDLCKLHNIIQKQGKK